MTSYVSFYEFELVDAWVAGVASEFTEAFNANNLL
jgi:hypothetical protein